MDYMLTFVGHIVESKRLSGFPQEIAYEMFARVDNLEGLRKLTNDTLAMFIRGRGMIVFEDPQAMREQKFEPDSQIFVPMHMISHITTKTKALTLNALTESDVPPTVQ